jgi:hypothetical protein
LLAIYLAAFAATSAQSGQHIPSLRSATESATAVAIADEAAARRGNLSQVAVLGTAHLSELPKDFDMSRLAGLIDKLAAWKPERIAIESLSGPQCDYLKAYEFAYPGTWKDYCRDPAVARTALGLDGAAAEEEIARTLATPTANRPTAQRRRLAALFLAAGEPASALVQWLRLPASERHSDNVLSQALVDVLTVLEARRNENYLIAAPLAVRLGHERLYSVDDQTAGRATGSYDEKQYEQEIMAIWKNDAVSERRSLDEGWNKRLAAGGDVLGWYRWMNSPQLGRLAVTGDFGAAAGANVPGNSGRKYLAYWETRNLRMVANIREAVGPGTRLLAIVGASHKSYYERYLGVSSDIEIADIDQILK